MKEGVNPPNLKLQYLYYTIILLNACPLEILKLPISLLFLLIDICTLTEIIKLISMSLNCKVMNRECVDNVTSFLIYDFKEHVLVGIYPHSWIERSLVESNIAHSFG
jgi:hypothetical protein